MSKKVWFITGASRGFGRLWTEAALARGDQVAATARNVTALNDLVEKYGELVLPLSLDVSNHQQVSIVVQQAHQHFGRLDVVLNNAGYALVGAIEEANIEDVKTEFNTNFFGALSVIQAALPILRAQQRGHIISVSSVAGIVAGPITGIYNSSKWALEAMLDSLSQEVQSFGIKVTILEPGAYATDFSSAQSLDVSTGLDAYQTIREQVFAYSSQIDFGEPKATVPVILNIVDAEEPPLRIFIGTEGLPHAKAVYAARLAEWEKWHEWSAQAQGTSTQHDLKI